MFEIDREQIAIRRKEQRHSIRSISDATRKIDPQGKGVSTSSYNRLELGSSDPRWSTITLVCEALGISPRSIIKKAGYVDHD